MLAIKGCAGPSPIDGRADGGAYAGAGTEVGPGTAKDIGAEGPKAASVRAGIAGYELMSLRAARVPAGGAAAVDHGGAAEDADRVAPGARRVRGGGIVCVVLPVQYMTFGD